MTNRPRTTVVLAMSADGKIADVLRSPARFGSAIDRRHLEEQVAAADAVLFGAATLRTYGTTLRVTAPDLQAQRQEYGQSPQPIQIVCSASGNLDPQLRFFQQPVPRWLLTTSAGKQPWQSSDQFARILVAQFDTKAGWAQVFQQIYAAGVSQLAVLGGGELVASLVAADLIDEFSLTLCPLLLGGRTAPTPLGGAGFAEAIAPRLKLLSVRTIEQEVFLRYQVQPHEFTGESS